MIQRIPELAGLKARTRRRIAALLAAGQIREASDFLQSLSPDDQNHPGILELGARLWLDLHDPGKALECSQRLVVAQPQSAGAWDLHGRVLNNLRRPEQALEAFQRACKLAPDFADAWFHAGHVLRGLGRFDEAREMLQRSVTLDPSHAKAWQCIGGVAQQLGETGAAVAALRHARDAAGPDPTVHRDLALALHAAGDLHAAQKAFEVAVGLDPRDPLTRQGLGVLYHELRDSAQAEIQLKKAVALAPSDPGAAAQLAHLYDELNRVDDARLVVAKARATLPDDPMLRLEAARQCRRDGAIDAAVALLEPMTHARMPPRSARQVHHELGRLYDRSGRFDDAWTQFSRCNELARGSERAANVSASRFTDRIESLTVFFARHAGSLTKPDKHVDAAKTPSFLLGFPRSGTTLTDVMLDSHPDICSIEERPTLNAVEAQLKRRPEGYPGAMLALTGADLDSLRDIYFAAVREHARPQPGALLLDKLPMRTIHSGLIWRLFPDAKLILALRHPCDVILSNFMQDYALNDMTANFFDIDSAARIYAAAMRLWHVYATTLPLKYTTIRYEDLVDDRRGQIGRLLDFLGLHWHEAMDDYLAHVSRRGRIDTTSFDQVSEPVYRRSRLRWHNYRRYLEPTLPLLDEHIHRFGYET